MNNRERSSLEDAASTAHMISGVIRTGKAISGAAKGAAAGGPYGAAVVALLGAKNHIGTIVAVVVFLLLLPVLFILMLPSVIFGGLTDLGSPGNPDQPIYAFLHEKGWAPGEYYDIAAFGFLRAVMRYLSEPGLRQYAFSTVAWRAMGQSIASYHRAEARRLESEQRYLQTVQPHNADPYEELEANLILHDLVTMTSEEQYRLATMRLQGYSIAETARSQGMSPKRVRKLLREMYQVYLQLYKD